MSWLDRLRPASFRGVPFYVETTKKTLGRRVVVHEFPNRETPFTQDMGRVANAWSLEGHVLGTDYDLEKKKLEDAFNKYGPGELVHPYDGLQMVQVGPVEFSESTREGAILYFSATIYEAGSNEFPKSVNDKASVLNEAAEQALADAKSDFDNQFSIAGMPGFAVESARAKIAAAQEAYDESVKGIADVADGAAQLAYSTRNLVAETNDLLQSPSRLSQRLLDSFSLIKSAVSSANLQTGALSSFFSFGSSDPESSGNTPVRVQEQKNKEVFNNLMKRAAAINACTSAQQAEFASFQEAEETREQITSVIEEQVRIAEGTDVYQSLVDVHAALVSAVPDVDSDLPNVKEITTENVTSSLHLAHDLFEDSRVEADIISRNNIKNPGLIPEGTVLEVLDGNI